jgi:hypothetical protein
MTDYYKELMISEIGARMQYGVKFQHFAWDDKIEDSIEVAAEIYSINRDGYIRNTYDDEEVYLDDVKLYLYPLSSISEEKLYEVSKILGKDVVIFKDYIRSINHERNSFSYLELNALFEWFNKNHFDYKGLIEKGLAIDATNLNIY